MKTNYNKMKQKTQKKQTNKQKKINEINLISATE